MVGSVEIKGREVLFKELRGATRGTDYFYIESKGRLIPVRLLGSERFVEEWGGKRKEYEIKVDIAEIEDKNIYHFSFSRKSGYLNVRLYKVKNGEVHDLGFLSDEKIKDLKFWVLGDERSLVEEFREMIEEIREIERSRGFEFFFSGHAERTKEAVTDPDMAYITSMVLPDPNSRINSLKVKRRTLHEIWILAHIIDALNGDVEDVLGEKRLWIETASETPTAFLKTPHCDLTVWYQFPIWEQLRTVAIGALTGIRHHVRPDIIIFKGIHRYASNVRTERGDRIRVKAVVVDPKIEIRESDIDQLRAYTQFFPEGSKFICPCMDIAGYKLSGWEIIENVRSRAEGISIFRERIRKAVSEICSS